VKSASESTTGGERKDVKDIQPEDEDSKVLRNLDNLPQPLHGVKTQKTST
jgi:hypothetical protein